MAVNIPALSPVFYEPIKAVRVAGTGSAAPSMRRLPEAAALTIQIGVPAIFDGAGNLKEAVFTAADVVVGVTTEPGHNLTVAGIAQAGVSEAAPPNQPSGVIIPPGAWIRDGKLGIYLADASNVFSVALKITTPAVPGATGAGQRFTNALIQPGVYYALVKDTAGFSAQGIAASNFWYLDTTITTGPAAVAQIVGFDDASPNDGINGARVFFTFKASQRFFQ